MRLAAAALAAGLLYLLVALTGLGATALAHGAPDAILLAGQAAPTRPSTTATAATDTVPPAATQVPREVSVGRPVPVVPASPRPAQTEPASANQPTTSPLVDDTSVSPGPSPSDLPGDLYLLTPAVPDVTATTLPNPLPVPTPTPVPAPIPSPTNPGLLGGLLGHS